MAQDVQREHIRVVSAEIQRDGHFLITQRLAGAVLPLLWEFPGGRVREGETPVDTLRRCLADRLDVEVHVGEEVLEVTHAYDTYVVTLSVHRCRILTGEPAPRRVAAVAWVLPDAFADYAFPSADQRTVRLLLDADE